MLIYYSKQITKSRAAKGGLCGTLADSGIFVSREGALYDTHLEGKFNLIYTRTINYFVFLIRAGRISPPDPPVPGCQWGEMTFVHLSVETYLMNRNIGVHMG
jgi:hypothetical protein